MTLISHGRAAHFVRTIHCRRGSFLTAAGDGANRDGRRFQVGDAGCQIGHAGIVVPAWVVVVEHAEVRSANGFQIVRKAGMGDREIVGGQVRISGIPVDERSIRVADDLAVSMIFHHDYKRMIEVGDAGRYATLLSECRCSERDEQANGQSLFFHCVLLVTTPDGKNT